MGRVKSQRDLTTNSQHFGHRQLAQSHQVAAQRLTFQQLHDKERRTLVFTHVVDRHHMLVLESRCRARLTPETQARITIG